MMECPICGRELEEVYGELICNRCCAAFGLELLGYYKEGSTDRIEAGPEFQKWEKKWDANNKMF